ncbi:ENDOU endoribonuclease, partial [Tyrannus savana]|nr:ENDOU endoribonuclease [Tyrannus savana]
LYTAPESCEGRCGEPLSEEDACHCHPRCESLGSCCGDYDRHCGPGGFSRSSDSITERELLELSEQLLGLDHNRARPGDIAINPQHRAGPGEEGQRQDLSPQPLYKHVNEELFSKPTYSSFIKLLDNYQRATGRGEEVTAEELREQDNFLGEVMKTQLMRELFAFLRDKSGDGSREPGMDPGNQGCSPGLSLDPALGVSPGRVGGFLGQERLWGGSQSPQSGSCDPPIPPPLQWDSFPTVLGLQFSWDGFHKEVGSAFIGSSPEFELGLYTLCFLARPGRA